MKYGLEDTELDMLLALFGRHREIESVILYGSRAKGVNKPFSDVDITLVGTAITRHTLNELSMEIDDLLLPYQFDISIFNNLRNEALIDHITRRGIVIYNSAA